MNRPLPGAVGLLAILSHLPVDAQTAPTDHGPVPTAAAAVVPTPAATAVVAPATLAQAVAPPIVAMRLADGERLPLDASLAHPAWQRAPVHDAFVGKEPVYGVAPAHRTRVRVLFDDHAIYVGVEALDDEPQRIRRPLVRHDLVNRTQDFVVLYLDGMGRKQSAQFFRVNAGGSLGDGMHTHGDDFEDFAPDFDFDAVVASRPDGWNALFRIPFASLRYGADTPWRMMVGRRAPREQFHLSTSTPVPPDSPSFIANLQPLQGVVPPAEHALLVLRPSVTLRSSRDAGGGAATRRETKLDASLDLKWRPRAELVVDGTLNPDFSQVALDVPQLSGNTAFALELKEKRPFFFESSDLLRSPTPALYTRSITAPRWGLRGTWRSADVSGTAFAIDDRGGGLTLLPGAFATGVAQQPGSRTLAGRVVLDGRDGAMQWGGLWAARQYEGDGGENVVAGPEVSWQLSEPLRLRAQWLHSRTTAQPRDDGQGHTVLARGAATEGDLRSFKIVHQTEERQFDLLVNDLSAGYRNDTGFTPQNGVTAYELHGGRVWRQVGPLNELWFNLTARGARDHDSGRAVSASLFPGFWMAGPRNLWWNLELHALDQVRARPDGPLLPQRFFYGELNFSPATWFPLVESMWSVGRLADVVEEQVRPGARLQLRTLLRPAERLELEPRINAARLQRDGQASYREFQVQLLGVWHFDARQTLRAIVQTDGVDRRDASGQPSLSLRGRANSLTWALRQSQGTVYYVGAANGRDVDGRRHDEVFVKLQVDVDEWRQGRR